VVIVAATPLPRGNETANHSLWASPIDNSLLPPAGTPARFLASTLNRALAIFVSDTKTDFECPRDRFVLNESESTGITNFGSRNMPFVMKGDFDDDEVRAREISRLVLAGGRRTGATENT
jgi:hypothetical protein